MLLDAQALLSDKQDLAQTNATYYSTNSYDLGVGATLPAHFGTAHHDPGKGKPVEVICRVTEAFTTSASGTLQCNLVMSANANLSSPTILATGTVNAVSVLVAGYEMRNVVQIPHGTTARYLGMQYVIGTGAMTAGKVTAAVVVDSDDNYKTI